MLFEKLWRHTRSFLHIYVPDVVAAVPCSTGPSSLLAKPALL